MLLSRLGEDDPVPDRKDQEVNASKFSLLVWSCYVSTD